MKYIVWIKCTEAAPECYLDETTQIGVWTPNGDGEMGQKTAERIAREIPRSCPGVKAKALPKGQTP